MKGHRALVLVLILFVGVAYAHEDRTLHVLPDGTIPEVPASFGHVALRVSGLGGPAPEVEFISGTHHNILPLCVTRLIRTRQRRNVSVTGSWHNDRPKLPPYVAVRFYAPGYMQAHAVNSSFDIVFNLSNAEIIQITRVVADASGDSGQSREVVLPKGCNVAWYAR